MPVTPMAAPSMAGANFTSHPFRYAEIEEKIARRDFHGITKDDLPTPCIVVEKSILEKNIQHLAGFTKDVGIDVRPHCKVHKSTDIGKRQVAAGALGICCATIAEAELMSGAGIQNTLYTVQPAGKNKIWRAVMLALKDPTAMFVADNPHTVDLLDEAAGVAGIRMKILVDLYAGLTRAGYPTGKPGLEFAKNIDGKKNLEFVGVMGYSGWASHMVGFADRKQKSIADVIPVVETAMMCKAAGLNVQYITGGSTGTYNIDKALGLTELQAGSYVFMDTSYMYVGTSTGQVRFEDFDTSLTVLTTVISCNHANQVTIDCGNKGMLRVTDQVKGRPELEVENQGAEYGILKWKDGDGLRLGEKVELYSSNLDTTTNAYDRYYVFDGENLVDVWPIMGRAGALQR